MVRFPRLFGKKRGERRTGSPAWGRVTEAILSFCLLVAGLLHGAVVIAGIVRPTWRIGFGVPVYDGDPSPASLWVWLLGLLLPVVLLMLGMTGLVRAVRGWGRSEERRAAMGRLPDLLAPVAGAVEAEGLPAIPAFDHLTNSPGTALAFRLPTENAEGWSLFAAGLFAVSWNTMLVVFVTGGGLGLRSAAGDPMLAMILIAFGGVGLGAMGLFIRRFLGANAIGPTHLEVSRMPLEAGGRCDLRLTQSGTCAIRSIAIHLEQEEQATYRQGTDVRIERRIVNRVAVAGWQDLRIGPASRFDGDAEATVPARAMHSFISEHNGVSWRFVVEGETAARPASRFRLSGGRRFERAFPVVVVPAGPQSRPAVEPAAEWSAAVIENDGRNSFDPRREVRVRAVFDRASKAYAPGDTVCIQYAVEGLGADAIEGVERSVLWYTEGKGDEDLGVVSFERIGFGGESSLPWKRLAAVGMRQDTRPEASAAPSPLAAGSLAVRLPVSPLSYEGLLVKVSWCVRVRVFFARPSPPPHGGESGAALRPSPPRDFVSEHVFQVGQLNPAGWLSETRTA
jgi:hypothetical protein